MALRKLPLVIQGYLSLREEGYLYVDQAANWRAGTSTDCLPRSAGDRSYG